MIFSASLSFAESSLDGLYEKAEELIAEKKFSEVLAVSDEILQTNPDDFNGQYYKAVAYLGLEKYENATSAFEQILQEHNVVPNKVLFNYGMTLFGSEKYDTAIQYFDIFDKSDPYYPDSLNQKGLALTNIGNYTQAVDVFDQLISFEKSSLRALANKANVLTKLEKYDEAIKVADAALEINPKYVIGIVAKGNVYFHQEKYVTALKFYNDALALEPFQEVALNQKGLALFYLKRYDEALNTFDKILEKTPNSIEALVNKANILFEQQKFDESLELLQTALKINPSDIDALNNAGAVYSKKGEHEKAVEFFNKVLEIDNKNIDTLHNKVLALGQLGDNEGALKTAEQILQIDPGNKLAMQNREIASSNIYAEKLLEIEAQSNQDSLKLQTQTAAAAVILFLVAFSVYLLQKFKKTRLPTKFSLGIYVSVLLITWMLITVLLVFFVDLRDDASAFTAEGDLANWASTLLSMGAGFSITLAIFIHTTYSQRNLEDAVGEIKTTSTAIQTVVGQIDTTSDMMQGEQKNISNLVKQVAEITRSQQQSEMDRKKNLLDRVDLALPILKFGSEQRKNLVEMYNKNPAQREKLRVIIDLNESHPITVIVDELKSVRNAGLLSFNIETKIRNLCNEATKKPFLNSKGEYEYLSNVSHEKLVFMINDLEKSLDELSKHKVKPKH